MNKARMNMVLTLIVGLVLSVAMTLADPTGVESLTVESSERGNISNNAQSTEAQAGNVTEISLTGTAITKAWQGYFGNITGTLTLENSAGNVFYNWSGLGSVSGEVYASRNDSVQWSTIACSNTTENSNENSYLGKDATDPDSVGNTFGGNSHPTFLVGDVTINTNTCNSTNAYINTGSSATDFYQVLLADGNSNIVYSTIIDEDQTSFDGSPHDFELLVGENGNSTSTGSTPYFFYIELS